MAFNFGAFLGGMSRQIVKGIEDEEERQFKFDMLAEEEATRMRLSRASERRAERQAQKEQAGLLKAMGFSDAKAAWIMKGGSAAVNQYVDYAVAAKTRGINPDTMLDSSLFSSDQEDPRNEAAMAATLGQPRTYDTTEPFRIDTDIMTSVLGEIKEPKEVKQYGTLEAGHAGTFSLLQAAKADGDTAEVTRLEGVLKEWQTKINEANPEEIKEDKLFTDDSRQRIKRDALTMAREDQQFTVDVNGAITSKLEGRAGPAAVAKLYAAASIENTAKVPDTDIVDTRLISDANYLKEQAYDALDKFGKKVAYSAGQDDDIKTYGYFKTKKNESGEFEIQPFFEEMKKANRGAYKAGDTVLVKQKETRDGVDVIVTRIKVYTGVPVAVLDYQGRKLYDLFHDAGEYITD